MTKTLGERVVQLFSGLVIAATLSASSGCKSIENDPSFNESKSQATLLTDAFSDTADLNPAFDDYLSEPQKRRGASKSSLEEQAMSFEKADKKTPEIVHSTARVKAELATKYRADAQSLYQEASNLFNRALAAEPQFASMIPTDQKYCGKMLEILDLRKPIMATRNLIAAMQEQKKRARELYEEIKKDPNAKRWEDNARVLIYSLDTQLMYEVQRREHTLSLEVGQIFDNGKFFPSGSHYLLHLIGQAAEDHKDCWRAGELYLFAAECFTKKLKNYARSHLGPKAFDKSTYNNLLNTAQSYYSRGMEGRVGTSVFPILESGLKDLGLFNEWVSREFAFREE